jgi:hypothetical protein
MENYHNLYSHRYHHYHRYHHHSHHQDDDEDDDDSGDNGDSDGYTNYGDSPFVTQGATHLHLLYTGNEFPPPLIDGLPPYFNNETQSDVTDHSDVSDFYEYNDMSALSDV